MVGLTHLRQDAVLSAKHLDQIVFLRLFSIRLFSFTNEYLYYNQYNFRLAYLNM